VAINEVIIGNKILTENHLIFLVDLFGLNPKQTRSKNYGKREMGPLFFPPAESSKRKQERGLDGGEEQSVVSYSMAAALQI
jgi:hypothetical protein